MKQTQGDAGVQKQISERNAEIKKEDQIGGTWPNQSPTKQGPRATGRTGPIDDVHRDEYDEPGENAAANEPECCRAEGSPNTQSQAQQST